eukprot:scaffold109172_cov53-Phaeocystis_antarctica.AAC.3
MAFYNFTTRRLVTGSGSGSGSGSASGSDRQAMSRIIAKRIALLVTGSAEPQCLVVLEVGLSPAPRSRVGTSSLLSHPARPLAQPPPAHLTHLFHLGRRVAPLRTRSGSTQAARRCPRGWWRGITSASAAGRTRATGRLVTACAPTGCRGAPGPMHTLTLYVHMHMHPRLTPAGVAWVRALRPCKPSLSSSISSSPAMRPSSCADPLSLLVMVNPAAPAPTRGGSEGNGCAPEGAPSGRAPAQRGVPVQASPAAATGASEAASCALVAAATAAAAAAAATVAAVAAVATAASAVGQPPWGSRAARAE